MQDEPVSSARLTAFFALERRDDLFGFLVDGWSAWRVLRNPLHRMAEDLPLKKIVRSRRGRILAAVTGTIRLAIYLIRGRRCEWLVKVCRSDLRMPVGERFCDIFFDGLLSTGKSYFKLEEINSPDFEKQASVALFPPQLDSVVFTFWGKLLAFVYPVSTVRSFCDTLSDKLSNEIGITVSAKWLRARISTAYWQSRLYTLLLTRLSPKAVLVSDTGEYGLIIACKRLGIKLIEVQHGVFDAHHPDAVPVWAQGSSAQLLLPDVLACRGNYWIEQLTGTRQGRDHSSAVGSELIDIARDRRAARAAGGPIRFVVSSQGLDSERLAEWLAAFVGAAPVNVKWELAIKLHPVYDAGTHCYDDLARDPHIRVVAGGALPNIYDLLVDADLHLSIASACHFDAAALGVPSGIIPLAGYETMLGAVDGRFFQVVQQPSGAWTLPRSIPVAAGFRFSAPGYRERLLRLVE